MASIYGVHSRSASYASKPVYAEAPQEAVALVRAMKDLVRVLEPHVALALWERELPSAFLDRVDRIDLGSVDDLDVTTDVFVSGATLAASLLACGYPGEAASLLAADMLQVGSQLASLVGTMRVRMRLEVVETDACRKFHADHVTLRLLATYRGPATQWSRTVRRDTVEQIGRGAAAVLKGRLMMEEPRILHRSPPISGTGERRLLLTIDPPRQSAA